MKVDWQLRYRSPLSPTKGVDDVIIQTNSPDEAKAREVAQDWLATKMAHPGTRLVYVRPNVVHTEDAMLAALDKATSPPREKPADPGGRRLGA